MAPRNGTRVHLVSVGNLIQDEAKIGLLSCRFSAVVRAAELGFLFESYDPTR